MYLTKLWRSIQLVRKKSKWSDYKKVPILMVDGEQLNDSSAIIDKLGQKILSRKMADSTSDNDEETKWRQYDFLSLGPVLTFKWVDNHLVHVMSPTIYRNTSEALESFDYITSNGGFNPNLADLVMFGDLRPIRYLRSGRDMVEHTRIGEWYTRMESAVGEPSRIKAKTGFLQIHTFFLLKPLCSWILPPLPLESSLLEGNIVGFLHEHMVIVIQAKFC